MPFVELGDVRLFYTDDGPSDTEPLLLVHGFAADSHDWIWHIPELARTHRVIAVDLRGHGYSSAPESGYRPQDLAYDLVRLLDQLSIERVTAFGHSMGAMVVSALAVEHPDRVRALVCIDPSYGQPPDKLIPDIDTQVANMRRDAHRHALKDDEWCYNAASPAFLKAWHARKILGTPPHVLAEAFAAIYTGDDQFGLRPASEAYLAGRLCPVLSFSYHPRRTSWEQGLFKHPSSRVITWPGSSHRLHAERPAEFLLVVKTWLEKLDKEKLA